MLRYHVVLKACAFILLASVLRQHAALDAAENSGGVTGVVFLDKNGNGIRDLDEPGFPAIVVTLFGTKSDGSSLYLSVRTDSSGRFAFPGELIGNGSRFTVSTGGAPLAAAIPTAYRAARTFYTATDGDDKNPGSPERPFRTIGHAVPLLQAGDLLYIRKGEYRDCISSDSRPLGGGSGWDRPIVVAGMPGETVVVRPPDRIGGDPLISLALQRQQYLVFDNLVLDGEGVTLPLVSQSRNSKEPPPGHVRLINCELKNARGSAVFVMGEDHQFINCRIHDNGHAKTDHGLHVSGGHNLVQGCDIYHNAGWGIFLEGGAEKTASNNVIRGNRIHHNDLARQVAPGIGLYNGSRNLVYDNVIWANAVGIIVSSQGCEEQIFNNTISGNHGPGIAVATDEETRDNVVRNNIVTGNRDPNLHSDSKTTIIDHNMVEGNPRFRDVKANDFHLQRASPAIDAGVTIAEVRSDHDGISRPQGKAYDMGAYEYSEQSFVPTTSAYSSAFAPGQTYPVVIGFMISPKKP